MGRPHIKAKTVKLLDNLEQLFYHMRMNTPIIIALYVTMILRVIYICLDPLTFLWFKNRAAATRVALRILFRAGLWVIDFMVNPKLFIKAFIMENYAAKRRMMLAYASQRFDSPSPRSPN